LAHHQVALALRNLLLGNCQLDPLLVVICQRLIQLCFSVGQQVDQSLRLEVLERCHDHGANYADDGRNRNDRRRYDLSFCDRSA